MCSIHIPIPINLCSTLLLVLVFENLPYMWMNKGNLMGKIHILCDDRSAHFYFLIFVLSTSQSAEWMNPSESRLSTNREPTREPVKRRIIGRAITAYIRIFKYLMKHNLDSNYQLSLHTPYAPERVIVATTTIWISTASSILI